MREHDDMAACLALAGGRPTAEPAAVDLARVRSEVDRHIAAERGVVARLRAAPRRAVVVLLVSLTLALCGATVALSPRADLGGLPMLRLSLTLVLLSSMVAAAAWRLLRPLHQPPARSWSGPLLAGLGVLAPLGLALWPLGDFGERGVVGPGFFAGCSACLAFGGVFGLPVALVAWLARRAGVDGPAIAALVGVMGGLAGNLVLAMHCPSTALSHLLVGHVALLLPFMAVAIARKRAAT